jgi:hypothetical protein
MGHPFNKSARDNYGKACARSQGSGGDVNSFLSPFFLTSQADPSFSSALNFQNKIFIFYFAIKLTLLNLSK